MSENNQLEKNGKTKEEGSDVSRDRYRLWIWALVIGNTAAVIGIWCIAHQTNDWNNWANVVAVTVLGLASFDVATINALTSREMIETIKSQEFEMTEQRKISDRALDFAKESLNISERAYIGIGPIGVEGGNLIGGVPTPYTFELVNGGKTPAFDVFAGVREFTSAQFSLDEITYIVKNAPEMRNRRAPIIGKYLMAGKAEPADLVRPSTTDITETNMADVMAGKGTLFLFVDVWFEDFQRIRHHELFRFYFNIDTMTFLPLVDKTTDQTEIH
jgi:hypothetical protein